MTAPRHLWSGDWQRESAEAAQGLAERRGATELPVEPPPVEPEPARPSVLARAGAAVRSIDPRRAALIAVAALLIAGAAYGAVSALETSGKSNAAAAQQRPGISGGSAWLGADTTSFPLTDGAMIVDVVPGGPADAAGLQPGDVITEIDSHAIQTPGDLKATLARLHPGQQVLVGYEQGPSAGTYTTRVTLETQPGGP
jgi:membrane-associated protease RseP (regulator of RpoE activity)